jgi:hypothetical protein
MNNFEQFSLFDKPEPTVAYYNTLGPDYVPPKSMLTTTSGFYNTTSLTGSDLKTRKIKAGCETERILSFFEAHPNDLFAPFEVEARLFPDAHARHITNCRRSLTTLTKMGKLEKTEIKVTDPVTGELCHCWKLKTK